jgi:hypothetical protein
MRHLLLLPLLGVAWAAHAGVPVRGYAPAIDLGAVIERVHFAFRPADGGFSGGHSTYGVQVSAEGALSLRPVLPAGPAPSRSRLAALHAGAGARATVGAPLELRTVRLGRVAGGPEAVVAAAVSTEDGAVRVRRVDVDEVVRNRPQGVEQSWLFAAEPGGSGDLEIQVQPSGMDFLGQTASGLHFGDPASGLGFRYGHGTWIDSRGARHPVPVRFQAGRIVLTVPAKVLHGAAYPAWLDPTIGPESGIDVPVAGPVQDDQGAPAVAYGAGTWLVVWQDARETDLDIYGARLGADGRLLDPGGIPIMAFNGDQKAPDVAFDGQRFVVAWQDERSGTADIRAARVSLEGTVLEAAGIPVSSASGRQEMPSVAAGRGVALIAWQDRRNAGTTDIYGARLDAAGTVREPDGLAVSTATGVQDSPAVAFNGTRFLVVWRDARNGTDTDIYGGRVSTGGALADGNGFAISPASRNQALPAVASESGNWLVAWEDQRSGTSNDVYAARVSDAGVVLDWSGVAVSKGAWNEQSPSLAFSGTAYQVAWQDYRSGGSFDVYTARVSTAGALLDPDGVGVSLGSQDETAPEVAGGVGASLVVWKDERGSSADVHATRLSGDGALLDPAAINCSIAYNDELGASVATDGTVFLVAWHDSRNAATSSWDILGARVTAAGELLDPQGLELSAAPNPQFFPSVVYGDGQFLVAWQDFRSGASFDIYATRVTGAGVALDGAGVLVSAAAEWQEFPSVAFDGSKYLVAWQDYRSASSYDIYAARVAPDGTVLDGGNGFAVSKAAEWQTDPVASRLGDGFLVAWEDGRSATSLDVYAARVSSAGAVLDAGGIAVAGGVGNQSSPALASSGAMALVAWQDTRAGAAADIYACRLDVTGVVLDPNGIAVSSASGTQGAPAAGFAGQQFSVLWEDGRGAQPQVHAARVKTDGGILDPNGVQVTSGEAANTAPSVVFTAGGDALVVYQSLRVGSTNATRLYARRFSWADPPPAPIPTLDEWAMILGLLVMALVAVRRKAFAAGCWQAPTSGPGCTPA